MRGSHSVSVGQRWHRVLSGGTRRGTNLVSVERGGTEAFPEGVVFEQIPGWVGATQVSPQRKLAEVDGTLREVRRWWERSGRQTGPGHIGLLGHHMGFVPRSWSLPNLHHVQTLVSDPHVCTCRGLGHFLMVCLEFSGFCASLLNFPASVSDLPEATFSTAALRLTCGVSFRRSFR